MVIIDRAMAITGLKEKLPSNDSYMLMEPFQDENQVSAWAKSSAAAVIKSGIISGREGARLAPKANITRAEVAIIVRRLLQNSDLI